MSKPAYFVQECPVCGRPLQIRVEYLGRRLTCDHCGGLFIAAEARESDPQKNNSPSDDLVHRADALLQQSSMRLSRSHLPAPRSDVPAP